MTGIISEVLTQVAKNNWLILKDCYLIYNQK